MGAILALFVELKQTDFSPIMKEKLLIWNIMNKRKLVSAGIISTISIAIVLVFVFLAIPTIQAGSIMSSYSYKMFGSITEIDDLETIEDVSVENWDKADNSIRDFE
ncbi:MAG: hypothetical protein FWF98_04090, partial [Dehalococcoidia bacterium]|nr:hypothetical protein [Dehalococcoidia bacterium]